MSNEKSKWWEGLRRHLQFTVALVPADLSCIIGVVGIARVNVQDLG